MKFFKVTGKIILELKVGSTVVAENEYHASEEMLRYYEKLGFKIVNFNLYSQSMSLH